MSAPSRSASSSDPADHPPSSEPRTAIRPGAASGLAAGQPVEHAAQRLVVASLLCALAFGVAFPVMNYAPMQSAGNLGLANRIAAANIGLSLLVAGVARWGRLSAARLVDLGLVYQVVLGVGISVAELFATFDPFSTVRGVSWVCIWITVFPLVVPSTPGKAFLAAVATATGGPIALLVAVAVGIPPPSIQTAVYLVLPNYFAVLVSLVLARTLYRLRADVRQARQMGSYQLVELLGRGGMGQVWRATHRMLARPAAIKLVSPEVLLRKASADAQTLLARFEREARTTARLTSQHTIQIFDFGVTEDGTLYYVMELLDGTDLETLVVDHGPLRPARAVHLLRQVCDSLAEAHEAGLVHRDVKPANIYVCRLGTELDCVKVLDFGLVSMQAQTATKLTADGAVTGTPAYLAPELITGDREPDERIDVYALGCVAYWLLTGRLVFDGKTPIQLVYAHVEEPPAPPSRHLPEALPEELERLILDCLAKAPEDRPRSAREVGERLARCDVAAWSQEDARAAWRATPPATRVDPLAPTTDVSG